MVVVNNDRKDVDGAPEFILQGVEQHGFTRGLKEQQRRAIHMNFHEATICVTCDGNASRGRVAIYNLVSLLLVMLQIFVAISVAKGCSETNCSLNRHCVGARVCVPHLTSGGKTCVNCGDGPGLAVTQGYRNQMRPEVAFKCPATDNVCVSCYSEAAGHFSNYTYHDEVVDNISAMQYKDWLTLVLCSVVLGLRLSCELEDVVRCEILRKRFSSNHSLEHFHHVKGWIYIQQFTGCLRRSVIAVVCSAAYTLIAYRGGDALSICLNTVALTFLLKCDELLFKHAVKDSERAAAFQSILALDDTKPDDMEEGKGHVKADDVEALVGWIKLATTIFVPAMMLCVLMLSIRGRDLFFEFFDGGHLAFVSMAALYFAESQVKGRVAERGRLRSAMVVMAETWLGFTVSTCIALFV